jgi:hypothetical protein
MLAAAVRDAAAVVGSPASCWLGLLGICSTREGMNKVFN